jgi:F-type H+-transporting ATPase subunit b
MEQTLHQLGQILLGSIPTIIIFLILHFYLRSALYGPLQRTMQTRWARTEGKFETARQKISEAEAKTAGYEEAIRNARAEAYRMIDERRKHAMEQRSGLLARAREEAQQALNAARTQIAADTVEVKKRLRDEAQAMAEEIVEAVLPRSAAMKSG